MKSIYTTLILPHLNYCVLCWRSQTNRIRLLQKQAIRNINNANGYVVNKLEIHVWWVYLSPIEITERILDQYLNCLIF